MTLRVATGLERIAQGDEDVLCLLRGKRLGLCAHPASIDSQLRHARFVMQDRGLDLRVLFGPEHGYGGEAQDMIAVHDAAPSDLPVYSLYGDTEAALSPTAEQLAGLDAVVIDLQDVGARYYTFVWTAVLMLRAAAQSGVQVFVLDRPNPLGGEIVEGGPQRPGYRSFVGLCDVAVRHGMTIGELCHMVAQQEKLTDALHVVTLRGYERHWDFIDTGLPWVLPSPNMPTLDTALVYPGGCLLEGTNLNEGRGTTRPFEIWGAPFLAAAELARRVQAEGVTLRPLSFSPMFHKHARERCFGVQVHVGDRRKLRSYELYLRMIAEARNLSEGQFGWRTAAYEFVSDRPAIDLLTGGPEFREAVDSGADIDNVIERERASAQRFEHARSAFLLYRATHS
ncbi:MAG TPA: DUF1343 domain-containing protein [Polyangiales bacterium]|nr:DUF1343 domain-containing protein [Polyangiales bacterium]